MPTPTPPHAAPGSPSDEGGRWIVAHLETLARAVNIAARSASPITALAPHRVAIAELRGVARIDTAPPLGAVLDVVGRVAGATPATAPSAALVQPTLELAGRALLEGAAVLRAGLTPATDGATVLALAALVRAARPAATTTPAAQPISTLVASGAPPTPRPAAIARFRDEAVGAAERLRAALARVRAARDPITSDEATWEAMRFAAHLQTLAAEYGLHAVADCLETARRGLPALDARALWVLDEAGVELAEPGTPVESVQPRFLALRARLDGVQPPPMMGAPAAPPTTPPRAAPATHATPAALVPSVPSVPSVPTVPPAQRTPPAATAGSTLADLLRDGIAAFTSQGGPILRDALAGPHADGHDGTPRTAADSPRRNAPPALPDATDLAYRGPSARAAARALRDALARGERAATPATMDELNDLLRLAEE